MGTMQLKIQDMVQKSSLYLDHEDFDAYLELCHEDFQYRILAYSDELLKDMVWLDASNSELESLFENLNKHVRLQGKFLRHVSLQNVEHDETDQTYAATSSIIVIHTDLDGASSLYCAGRYYDVVSVDGSGHPLLLKRDVVLATRQIGAGPHVPM